LARKTQILPPKSDLRRKAVNSTKGIDLKLPKDTVAALTEVVSKSRDRFTTDIAARLAKMRDAHGPALHDADKRGAYVKQLYDESLNIKGAGGTIGFMLLTRMGKSLNDLVAGKDDLTDVQMDIVHLHIDALYVVLAQRIGGGGGTVEEQVLIGLESAVRRFA
jgi:hypothetical protein